MKPPLNKKNDVHRKYELKNMDIEKYSESSPFYYSGEIPLLLTKLLNKPFNTFLDCGCGDGSLLFALYKNKILERKKVYAIDLSKKRLNLVKQISSKIQISIDSAETLSTIDSALIDVLVSTMVIEHVDDRAMLKTIERVLKPGATAYITTVYKKPYAWYFYRNTNGKWVIDPTHLREYQQESELLDKLPPALKIVSENKKQQWFPIIDFFIKFLKIRNRHILTHGLLKYFRKIKIPILGYYVWEIVLRKDDKKNWCH
jgi:2-polyprenyl-3-methyl-5-hydroxy-6-metoxy-1,4-benzoquinol methylase